MWHSPVSPGMNKKNGLRMRPDDTGKSAVEGTDKMSETNPKFLLVLVDDSEELHQALHYASKRSASTHMRVALLYVVAPAEFAHWAGVGELMRQEARELAEDKMREHAEYVQSVTGNPPLMYIREGKVVDEVISLVKEEDDISVLVLGADTNSDSAGPVISYLAGRGISECRVPVVIVPGNLTDEQIDDLMPGLD